MKKLFAFLLACFVFLSTASAQSTQSPSVAAKAWLLLDLASGQVIASHNPHTRIQPESLTKLMTAYLVFNAVRDGKLSLNDRITISDAAGKTDNIGTKMFLKPGMLVTVRDLLQGMLVQSAGDAAIALAEAVSGNEQQFVVLMNLEAERMGMTATKFVNPHGSPRSNNYTTAYDLSLLSAHLIADHAQFYGLFSTKSFDFNGMQHTNRNRLLWLDPAVDGLLTAQADSTYSLIASAKRPARVSDRRLLSIVIGASSDQMRAQESLKLLNWGFQQFDTVKLYSRFQAIATPEVWKGSQGTVKVGFRNDLYVTVPKGMALRIKPVLEHRDPLIAPIQDGQRLGTLKIMVDGKALVEFPVVALESVNTASVFGRAWDTLLLWMK